VIEDIFSVQDEIATTIAERLQLSLHVESVGEQVQPPTRHIAAYELYLKGRKFDDAAKSLDAAEKLADELSSLSPRVNRDEAKLLADCAFVTVTKLRREYRMFGTPIALISVVDSDRLWFKSCIGLSVRETPRDISFCGHAILEDAPLIVEDALLDARFADNPLVTAEPKIRFYAGRPLRNGENFPVGALCIIDHEPRALSEDDRRLLDDLGLWAEAIFASKQLSEAQRALQTELDEAKRETMVDSLLHIWNRWAIVDILEREAKRALRHRDPLSVLMVEVEHMATIADRYGQSTADAMLKEVSRAFNSVLRPYDAVGRCGGEEFLVVLPDTGAHAAAAIAKRLRQRIEECTVTADSDSELVSCTASTGVACIERNAAHSSVDTLIASAADALRLAKGGNNADDERSHEQLPDPRSGRADAAVLESTDDDWLGNPMVAAQLASLRAHVVDD
jgi:diguanylate cyclase (GGDEF)-like protein